MLNKEMIREFYSEFKGSKVSEKEVSNFIDFLKVDAFDWLKENAKRLSIKQFDKKIQKEKTNLFTALLTLEETKKLSEITNQSVIEILQDELKSSTIGFVNYNQIIHTKNEFDRIKRNAIIDIGGSYGGIIPSIDIFVYNINDNRIIAFLVINIHSQDIVDALFHIKAAILKCPLMKDIAIYYLSPLTKKLISKDDIAVIEISENHQNKSELKISLTQRKKSFYKFIKKLSYTN